MKQAGWAALIAFAFGAAGPASGDEARTLRLGIPGGVQSLVYYHESSPGTAVLTHAVFDTLILYDEHRQRYQPLLAEAWRRVDDRTLDFDLRTDVKWHDGVALDADDVVYTLNWLSDARTRLRMQHKWAWIDHAEKLGRHKVRLVAKRATPSDLARLATWVAVMPEHKHGMLLDDRPYFGRDPIGTGPYRGRVADRVGIVLERVAAYRHGGAAKPPGHVARVVARSSPRTQDLLDDFAAGDLDLVLDAPPDVSPGAAATTTARRSTIAGYGMLVLSIDARVRPAGAALNDPRVRLALDTAIDRSALVARAPGARLPDRLCWREQAGCGAAPPAAVHDPAGARALLAAAGQSSLALGIAAQGDAAVTAAEIIARQWRTIGVAAHVEPVSPEELYVRQRERELDIAVIEWHAGEMPDVAETVTTFMASGFWDRHADSALHALAEASSVIMHDPARRDVMRQALARADDHAYLTVLGPLPSYVLHRRDVIVDGRGRYGALGVTLLDIRWR